MGGSSGTGRRAGGAGARVLGEEAALGRLLLPPARVVGIPCAGMKSLVFRGAGTSKGSPHHHHHYGGDQVGCQLWATDSKSSA